MAKARYRGITKFDEKNRHLLNDFLRQIENGGNVRGPASSTDGNVAVFDGTDGTAITDGGLSPADIVQMFATGWVKASETWTRTGNNTFTVPGDVTGKYQPKDKFKLTQDTVKYGVFTSVAYNAGTDKTTITTSLEQTLTASAITDPHYSKAANPQGFPYDGALLWSGSWNSGSITATGLTGYRQFRVHISDYTVRIPAFLDAEVFNWFRGAGGHALETAASILSISASRNGDTLTMQYCHTCNAVTHAIANRTVAEIWGLP